MIIGYAIALLVVILDLVSKNIVLNNMTRGELIEVIPGLFKLRFVYNPGMAFSLFSNATPVLFIISLAASVGIGYLVFKYSDYLKRKTLSIALGMVLGGTIGNLVDRFRTMIGAQEGVIDFLELWIGNKHIIGGSTFNIADSFLVIGCILLIIDFLILENLRVKKRDTQLKELEDGTKGNSRN